MYKKTNLKKNLQKGQANQQSVNGVKKEAGITLIALVVTIIVYRVFYDKYKKYSNLVGSPIVYINL